MPNLLGFGVKRSPCHWNVPVPEAVSTLGHDLGVAGVPPHSCAGLGQAGFVFTGLDRQLLAGGQEYAPHTVVPALVGDRD